MSGEAAFLVDLDRLDGVVGELGRCQRALEGLGADLDRQMRVLHAAWTGLAADAQGLAHAEWSQGLLEMRTALGAVRQVAGLAHDNYTRAAQTNLEMWRSAG